MRTPPKGIVLSICPDQYLTQGLSHCGVYSIKAILSAYGRDNKIHPKYYHPNLIGRLTGLTLGQDYNANILKLHGLEATTKVAENLSKTDRTDLLRNILSKNTPVMVRIGNGYQTNKYNPLLGRLQGHWITLWGYDDKKKLFYVYGSGLLKKYWSKNVPIGNTTRTYTEILRDWRFGKWQPWTWPFVGTSDYLYIEVSDKSS